MSIEIGTGLPAKKRNLEKTVHLEHMIITARPKEGGIYYARSQKLLEESLFSKVKNNLYSIPWLHFPYHSLEGSQSETAVVEDVDRYNLHVYGEYNRDHVGRPFPHLHVVLVPKDIQYKLKIPFMSYDEFSKCYPLRRPLPPLEVEVD